VEPASSSPPEASLQHLSVSNDERWRTSGVYYRLLVGNPLQGKEDHLLPFELLRGTELR